MRSGYRVPYRNDILDLLSPSGENTERNFLMAALVLVPLLMIVVPVLFVAAGLPVLLLIAIAGIVYAVFVITQKIVFEGIGSALFVLVVFNANVPLVAGPGPARVNILLVDAALVPMIVLLSYREYAASPSLTLDGRTMAVVCFGGFVLWSFVSAMVANGPSQSAAAMFGVSQFRNLLILLTSALVIRRTSIWCGIYPLVVSVGGNLFFAVAEVLKGSTFGLTYLGEIGGGYIGNFSLGSVSFHSGLYAGAFAGSSRVLVGIVLLSLPITVLAFRHQGTWGRVGMAVYVLAAAFLVRVSSTDAGMMALLLTLVISIAVLLYYAYRDREHSHLSMMVAFVLGVVATIVLFAFRQIRDTGGEQGSTANTGGGGSSDTNGDATATGPDPTRGTTRMEDQLTELLSRIPLVSTNSFSVRLQQYAAALDIGVEYPLVGLGGFNFGLLAESYGLPRQIEIHNTFFAYLVATGIPGLLAYLASVLAVVGVALYRAVVGGKHGLAWGMVAAGMIGFHALSFWVTLHTSATAYGTLWAISGLVIGADQ